MNTNEILTKRTYEEQSKHIKRLTRQIADLKEQIKALETENETIKNKLYDAEAMMLCNRLIVPEVVKPKGILKTHFVPKKACN